VPRPLAALLLAAGCAAAPPRALGASVLVLPEPGLERPLGEQVERVLASRRPMRSLRPLPSPSRTPAEIGTEREVEAIGEALARARRHEEEAAWDACAKEAGDMVGVATDVLARTGGLGLLRDLHLQIGACLSLGPEPANAQPHFRVATLLDEATPPAGVHREEAERALEAARAEVLARRRGLVRIATEPPGAEVWIDGRKVDGVTPLEADVRLGEHFVTLRRFRYESQTSYALLQPQTTLGFVLAPARRDTLAAQLAAVRAAKASPPAHELRLAQAAWSDAEQLVEVGRGTVAVYAVEGGRKLGSAPLAPEADEDATRDGVCAALRESCEPEVGGVPWYVWPLAGVAVVGAGVAIGFAADSQRGTVFCPSEGC
jgi:hypothetical protein